MLKVTFILLKNTVKTVILRNVIIIHSNCFLSYCQYWPYFSGLFAEKAKKTAFFLFLFFIFSNNIHRIDPNCLNGSVHKLYFT